MTQTRKAVYMQSVKEALPNTPSLTMYHVLANMVNQISAGKSTALAAKDINIIEKLIQQKDKSWSDMRRKVEGIPGLEEAVKVLKEIERERNNMTQDVDVVLANEKAERKLQDNPKRSTLSSYKLDYLTW